MIISKMKMSANPYDSMDQFIDLSEVQQLSYQSYHERLIYFILGKLNSEKLHIFDSLAAATGVCTALVITPDDC